jgi:subtilisin family serine protease
MPGVIEQDLEASGVAPVIVVLKQAGASAAAASSAGSISKHFVSSERSQESALLADLATGGGPVMATVTERAGRRRPAAGDESARLAARLRHRPVVSAEAATQPEPPPAVRYYPNLGVAFGTVDRAGLAALRSEAEVSEVVGAPKIGLIRPTRVRSAALRASRTWGIRRLGVEALWARGFRGQGVIVGHLDTGVDGRHPALQRAIHAFAVFDELGRQVVPDPTPAFDTEDHGTHTAGTIAGRAVGGRFIGTAPKAMLASAVVIEGGQVVARLLGGMDWAIGQGVRILSMSLGLRGWWTEFIPITQILRARGVLPVFAVGNEGAGTSRSPGNYPEPVSVGAIDRLGNVATFSSSQTFVRNVDPTVPDLVAPGVSVLSARTGGGYQMMDGTSMATPHVAGLAAVLLSAKPDATVDELERAILASCALDATWMPDRVGRGLPDAQRALDVLTGENG